MLKSRLREQALEVVNDVIQVGAVPVDMDVLSKDELASLTAMLGRVLDNANGYAD